MKFTNLAGLKTPGVYVREVSIFPPSIAQVPTAIPAFIGYTEKAEELNKDSLLNKPWRISSMKEYSLFFGGSPEIKVNEVSIDSNFRILKADINQDYLLYDCLQLYFANGGGDCYIVSVGDFKTSKSKSAFEIGLDALYEVDEPTMLVFPDAANMLGDDLYDIQKKALEQCNEMMDRVTICDLQLYEDKINMAKFKNEFRNKIGMLSLKYGAAYSPWVKSRIPKNIRFRDILGKIKQNNINFNLTLLTQESSLKLLVEELSNIIADSITIADEIKNYCKDTSLRPENSNEDITSIRDGFDRVILSTNSFIAQNDLENARKEYKKIFKQIYTLLIIIDKFIEVVKPVSVPPKFILKTEGYRDNLINKITEISTKLEEIAELDFTTSRGGANATASIDMPIGSATEFPIKTGMLSKFTTSGLIVNIITPNSSKDTFYNPDNKPAGDDTKISNNIKRGIGKLTETFEAVYRIIEQLQIILKEDEKVREAAVIQQVPPFKTIIDSLNKTLTTLPPSAAMAGIYARVDNDLGVWNAPANVSLNEVAGLSYNMTDKDQEDFNVDVNAGKSINALRSFTGMGIMVWGARTLAGNDNEWRYVPVRRFFNMVEESVMKSTKWAVFKSNDANLWIKIKGMIDNYLTLLWRQGALAGSKPDEAFFVRVGLNQTMTSVDILEGRLIVQIGMAVVRPAEFIILEFSHKLQTS